MTRAQLYPAADRTAQWFADDHPGVEMGAVERLVQHTTEGSGWSSYQGGAVAPTWTAKPRQSGGRWVLDWRQHYPASMSARALRHPVGGVATNTLRCAQVELVGTCVRGGPGVYWPDPPAELLEDVGGFLAWLHVEWGLELDAAPLWVPPSPWAGDRQRFTVQQWKDFAGICGHEHVPGQDHRDPGAFPITRTLTFARAALPPPAPTLLGDLMPATADERAALIADITRSVAEAVTGIGARNPVLVDDGTGARELPDGRDIDAIPTVLGELQHDQREQGKAIAAQGKAIGALAVQLEQLLAAVRALAAALTPKP
jgi:hypothetical protein